MRRAAAARLCVTSRLMSQPVIVCMWRSRFVYVCVCVRVANRCLRVCVVCAWAWLSQNTSRVHGCLSVCATANAGAHGRITLHCLSKPAHSTQCMQVGCGSAIPKPPRLGHGCFVSELYVWVWQLARRLAPQPVLAVSARARYFGGSAPAQV